MQNQPPILPSPWPAGPVPPSLPLDEVHIWYTPLDQPLQKQQVYWHLLSADEQARANRFRFDIHRSQYIVGRGLLRTLLGYYLQRLPAHIRFAYGDHGKPWLDETFTNGRFHFNLSHSFGAALYSFTWNRELGVDIEWVRPLPDADDVATMNFSVSEQAVYRSLPETQKPQGFFNCWTRKEAFIKAIGEGLSCPLDSFDVTLKPGEPARLLAVRSRATQADAWTLHSFTPIPEFVAAVIATGRDWRLRCFQWT